MKSYWIQTKEQFSKTQLYEFAKEFEPAGPLKIRISASTRYQLWINERYVCEGPCQGSIRECYYEEQDVTEYLQEGKNRIRVMVLHVTGDTFTTTVRTPKPMLWVEAETNGEVVWSTDADWSVSLIEGVDYRQGDMVMFSVNHFEHHAQNYSKKPLSAECYQEAYLENGCSICGELNFLQMKKSTLPQMTYGTFQKLEKLIRKEDRLIFDASVYTTSRVRVRVKGQKGDTVRIRYAECFVERADGWKFVKHMRDDQNGILAGPSDSIELNGGWQEIEFWWYRAFRYLEVTAGNLEELQIEIRHTPSHYPYEIQGEFCCSDENYNQMWEISKNTLLCCSHELFLDCPMFEQQQYCMDAYLEAMYGMQLSGDLRLIEKAISDLAQSQQPNGLLCANYPSQKVQLIPTFSIYWIMLVYEYCLYTDDTAFPGKYMGTVCKILEAFEGLLEEHGLVRTRYWSFTDWTPDWAHGVPNYGKEDLITTNSMMYSMGLFCAEKMAEAMGRSGLQQDFAKRRQLLNQNIQTWLWNGQENYYRDTLHTDGKSQHTAVWAILAEIETGERAKQLAEKMMGEGVIQCSFSMGYFLFRALDKTGSYEKAFSLFSGFQKMIDLHCTTWCENPDQPRSECHGWSASPLYELSVQILGVKRTGNGYREVVISPNAGHLQFAKGAVPTPYGVLFVQWEKKDGEILLSYSAPQEIAVTVQNAKVISGTFIVK